MSNDNYGCLTYGRFEEGKKMGVEQMVSLTYKEKIMVIWQMGDLISKKKRQWKKGNDMKDYEKRMDITRTGD